MKAATLFRMNIMEDQDFIQLDSYDMKKIERRMKRMKKHARYAKKSNDMFCEYENDDENFDRVGWREEELESTGKKKGKKGETEMEDPPEDEEEGEEDGAAATTPAKKD